RFGETLGSPIAILVWNRDWENWQTAMAHEPPDPDVEEKKLRRVHLPRPGHADLVGLLKYARGDARDVLERASARETTARVAAGLLTYAADAARDGTERASARDTTARVAAGAVAKRLLAELGITVGSHVISLGPIEASPPDPLPDDINAAADESPLRTLDIEAEARMVQAVDEARAAGDTLGGVFEVVARGVPVGLGSHVAWDTRLDSRLAQALMSIQAIKGVEIGLGFEGARRPGSAVHDEFERDPNAPRSGGYNRLSN